MSIPLFSVFYLVAVILLLWQAFRVMARGFSPNQQSNNFGSQLQDSMVDRTGRLTIHPELLNEEGRITDEDLLTVRFSKDIDPPKSSETPSE